MQDPKRAVIVRGMGAVCAAGEGCGALQALLLSGRSGIAPLTRFDARGGPPIAGLVPGPPQDPEDKGWPQRLALGFAVRAGQEALAQAGPAPGPTALVLGTNLEDSPAPLDALAEAIATALQIDGVVMTTSTACASSTMAIGHALALLTRGEASRVLVGGYDAITPELYAGFFRLAALSDAPCSPFSERLGLSLGDGAAFMVLELGAVEDAGLAVLGWGAAADAHHIATPLPDGSGLGAALTAALTDGGVDKESVAYVNAHGTGTEANDAAEWRGIRRVFDRDLPISSTKSVLGHTQGAAGMMELVATALCRELGRVPHTAGFTAPRPGAPPDPIADAAPRRMPCPVFAKLSAGFGGINAAVLMGDPRPYPARSLRPVYLAGVGAIGPGDRAIAPAGRAAVADALASLRGFDAREADPSTLWLTAAAQRALADAGLRLPRDLRHRTGLIVGQSRVSPARLLDLRERIRLHGVDAMSAVLFIRTLLDIPAGAASIHLGLRGPLDVLACGAASGGAAVVHAAWLLSTRPELAFMLAAGVDEHGPGSTWEGAAAAVLSPSPGPIRLAAATLGTDPEATLARACAQAGLRDPPRFGPCTADPRAASEGPLGLAQAAAAIRAGLPAAAVVSSRGTGLCSVLVLSRESSC